MAKGSKDKQEAPGQLEILRKFLNTWRIPNDTRQRTDDLNGVQAVDRFRNHHFPTVRLGDWREVVHLRDEIRAHLGAEQVEFLNPWLQRHPVRMCVQKNEIHPVSDGSLSGEIVTLVVKAVADGRWNRWKACPDCQWVFFDHTRNRGKVWCGMLAHGPDGRACGTIAKVKRWREKQKRQ